MYKQRGELLHECVRPDRQVLQNRHFEWLDVDTIDAAFESLKAHKAPGWDMLTKDMQMPYISALEGGE